MKVSVISKNLNNYAIMEVILSFHHFTYCFCFAKKKIRFGNGLLNLNNVNIYFSSTRSSVMHSYSWC